MPKHIVDFKSREHQTEELEIVCDDFYSMFLQDSYYQKKPMPSADTLVEVAWDSYITMQKLSLWQPPADDERMPTREELNALPIPDWALTLEDARGILMQLEESDDYHG